MGMVREARMPFRRATNVSLNAAMTEEAKALGIKVSRACEDGLSRQIVSERRAQWIADTAEAIAASNAYVAEHGLPVKEYRFF